MGVNPGQDPSPPCAAHVPQSWDTPVPAHGHAWTHVHPPVPPMTFGPCLEPPAPSQGSRGPVPGQQLPPATGCRGQGPLTSPAQGATAPGKQGSLWRVQSPVNMECKSSQAGNTCEQPGGGQGVPGTGGQSRNPPGCQVQQETPQPSPNIGGDLAVLVLPPPTSTGHRAGVSLGGSWQWAWEGCTLILPRGGRGGTVEGPGSPRGEWGVWGEQPSEGRVPSSLGVSGAGGAPAVCCVGSVQQELLHPALRRGCGTGGPQPTGSSPYLVPPPVQDEA